ncbi:hypothetical protein [Parasphingorhabdus sp.]|uniref:hypothetical protein n=1 Tax=Parasphingorhabdus sp. TaxID=2709688 RepID=UPI0030A63E65
MDGFKQGAAGSSQFDTPRVADKQGNAQSILELPNLVRQPGLVNFEFARCFSKAEIVCNSAKEQQTFNADLRCVIFVVPAVRDRRCLVFSTL